MSANTIQQNQSRGVFSDAASFWLFGYGSLIFKADFDYLQKKPAHIHHWQRRFWQGSHDHRGTESSPGRVVTLIEEPGSICHGMAYEITSEVLTHLDFREKNGYLRFSTEMIFATGPSANGLVYIATAENEAYLGAAPIEKIAVQINSASGPSGDNSEYLLLLAEALREMKADDPHVFAIEKQIHKLKRTT